MLARMPHAHTHTLTNAEAQAEAEAAAEIDTQTQAETPPQHILMAATAKTRPHVGSRQIGPWEPEEREDRRDGKMQTRARSRVPALQPRQTVGVF